ncbi:hypothetical protein C1H46_020946 [Malus baccata]|uniref:DUF4219 domain-containing protein n=1 Tax=Malus baccata TaxID=106549 RepID=A0A540M3V3_MALBA|nr:hypothetical protein C1H46_020946 [Malus baccata]
MSINANGEVKAPVFGEENYEFWSIKMKTIFKSHGLWELVDEGYETFTEKVADAETPPLGKEIVLKENMTKDAKALGIIQNSVTDQVFPRIAHEETSKGAWDKLKEEYRGDVKVRKVKLQTLRRDFEYARMKEGEPLNDYFSRMFELVNQLKTYGEELTDARIVQKILISLTRKYDNIVNVIEETRF